MGQKITTAGSDTDTTSRVEYAARLGSLNTESLESFEDLPPADESSPTTSPVPADESLEALWDERTPPEQRRADNSADVDPPDSDEPEQLTATERAQVRGVSELRSETVEIPTPEELSDDTPADEDVALSQPNVTVGDDVAELLDADSDTDGFEPGDSPDEPVDTDEPTLSLLERDGESTISARDDDVSPVQDPPADRNTPALATSDADPTADTAPTDPDGYWQAYTGVDAEETPTPGTSRDLETIEDLTGDGDREIVGPQNDRPPRDPNPEGSDDARSQLTGDGVITSPTRDPQASGTADADPATGTDRTPTDDVVQPGNLSQGAAYQHEREASRPTSFDLEYGASAKARDAPTWNSDDNTAAASGGIPIGPDDNDAASYTDLDEDLWHKPTTVTEMQEQYLLAEQELSDQRDTLEQQHDVSFSIDVDPTDDTTPSRDPAVQRAGDTIAETAKQQQQSLDEADVGWSGPRWGDRSPHNRTRQRRLERDERWDEYDPATESRNIMGETVEVATDPAPYEPTAGSAYEYPDTRADRVYNSLPDAYQANIDDAVDDISATVPTVTQTQVKREYMRSLETTLGTVRADDVDAVKLRVESEGASVPLLDAHDTTRQKLLTTKTKTFDTGYKDLFTTTGTVDVDDLDDVVRYQEENGYWADNNFHEQRSSVRGVVRHVESVADRHRGNPTDADQIFYVTDPSTDELKDVKVTVWESGLHTEERAASNNAERDATGRTIDQTDDIPTVEPGDPVLLSGVRPQLVRGGNSGTHTTSNDMLIAQVDDTASVTRLDQVDSDWADNISIPDHLSPRDESVREQLTSYTDGVPDQTRRGTGL